MPHGKKYVDGTRAYDWQALHPPEEAFEILKSLPTRNFDETVEVAMRLGIDPRKADQAVRGTVSLPHGTGKSVRVAVFAAGEAARDAEAAGADVVGSDDLVGRVEGGFLDFDVAIATPDLMGQVGKLGRVLGPRGLMPNPKSGTVTTDIGKAVSEFKAGKVEYRNDRNGNVHVPIGRISFERDALVDNYYTLLDELLRARPAASKGRFVKAATASSTMGPGIHIDPAQSREDRSPAAV